MSHFKNTMNWSLEYAPGKRLNVLQWLGDVSPRPVLTELSYEEVDALTLEEYDAYATALHYYYKSFWPMSVPMVPEQMTPETRAVEKKILEERLNNEIQRPDKSEGILKYQKDMADYQNRRYQLERKLDPKNPKWAPIEKSEQLVKLQRFYC